VIFKGLEESYNDNFVKNSILHDLEPQLQRVLGLYIPSGSSIFTQTALEESLILTSTPKNSKTKYEVKIVAETKKFFSGQQI
jgi:hypothetical protein